MIRISKEKEGSILRMKRTISLTKNRGPEGIDEADRKNSVMKAPMEMTSTPFWIRMLSGDTGVCAAIRLSRKL